MNPVNIKRSPGEVAWVTVLVLATLGALFDLCPGWWPLAIFLLPLGLFALLILAFILVMIAVAGLGAIFGGVKRSKS